MLQSIHSGKKDSKILFKVLMVIMVTGLLAVIAKMSGLL